MFDGAESVGNNHQRLVSAERFDRVADEAFRLVIQGGGGFIEDENLPIVVERPCNPDPLPLSTRKSHSSFSHYCMNALREALDHVRELGHFDRMLELLIVNQVIWHPECDVLGQSVFGEIDRKSTRLNSSHVD